MVNVRLMASILLAFVVTAACSKESSTEPKPAASVVGSWKLIEFTMHIGSTSETSNEQQLNEAGAVWTMELSADNNFTFTTNMVEGTLQTYSGTWRTVNQQLTMKFASISGMPEINYGYTVTNSQLTLTRSFPSQEGEVTTIAKFRRQ
jgi:hypothetical protein